LNWTDCSLRLRVTGDGDHENRSEYRKAHAIWSGRRRLNRLTGSRRPVRMPQN
jgi:hypothetical protein